MNRNRTFIPSVLVLIAALCGSLPAAAETLAGPEILARMDKANNGYADQRMDVTMTIVDTNGSKKSYDLTITQKGGDKRLIRFTSGEIKGMATLIESRNRMSVYLPGFKKVRPVAAHNMNQSFAGSDFSNDDMASPNFSPLWDATLAKEDGENYYLDLKPKAGQNVSYARATATVRKVGFLQMLVEYFNEKGEKVKIWESRDVKEWNGKLRPALNIMKDARTGHATELHVKTFTFNNNVPDAFFTVRELEWGK